MIYMIRGHAETLEIACCETETLAQRRYATGWQQIDREAYVFWWGYFAKARLLELTRAARLRRRAVLIERVIGGGEIY